MRQNISHRERAKRGAIGIALLLLGFSSNNWAIFTSLLLLGTVLMGEAFSGHCVYRHYKAKR